MAAADTKKGPLKSDPFVIRMRLERMTVCLEGRCSIQLSYRTIIPYRAAEMAGDFYHIHPVCPRCYTLTDVQR